MQTNQELTNEIMKLVRNMADDNDIAIAILSALQIAYRRGFCAADRNPRQPESMGR